MRQEILAAMAALKQAIAAANQDELILLESQIRDVATVGNKPVERYLPINSQQDLNFALSMADVLLVSVTYYV